MFGGLILTVAFALTMLATSEGIRVGLDIEENTRAVRPAGPARTPAPPPTSCPKCGSVLGAPGAAHCPFCGGPLI
jgi:hypothetical protein